MIQINMEMPKNCLECRFMDINGDYPTCTILNEARGYTFDISTKRFHNCPIQLSSDKYNPNIVEVIRCKECAYYDGEIGKCKYHDKIWFNTYPYRYCSEGYKL